jgi:hypothetical protein
VAEIFAWSAQFSCTKFKPWVAFQAGPSRTALVDLPPGLEAVLEGSIVAMQG